GRWKTEHGLHCCLLETRKAPGSSARKDDALDARIDQGLNRRSIGVDIGIENRNVGQLSDVTHVELGIERVSPCRRPVESYLVFIDVADPSQFRRPERLNAIRVCFCNVAFSVDLIVQDNQYAFTSRLWRDRRANRVQQI